MTDPVTGPTPGLCQPFNTFVRNNIFVRIVIRIAKLLPPAATRV